MSTTQRSPASVWQLTGPAHAAMIGGGLLALLGAALKIVPYIGLVEIAAGWLTGADAGRMWWWFAVSVMAMAAHGVGYAAALAWTHHAEADLRHQLRLMLVNKLPRTPLGWFTERSSGRINRAVLSETEQIHTLVAHLTGDLMNALGTIIVGFGYLLWRDARFAGLLMAGWLLIMALAALRGMVGMQRIYQQYSAAQQELAAVTVEMVDGIKEVKNFGMTADVFGRFDKAARRHADVTMSWTHRSGAAIAIMAACTQPAAMLTMTIALGFWLARVGWVDPLTVVTFALIWVAIPEGLLGLVQIIQHLYAAQRAAEATLEILNTPELFTPAQPAPLTADPALIEIDRISFGYEPDRRAIDQLSLTCRPGTVTALVGPSGGGKTTLARLIARFWDVDSGQIRIGGADIREQTDRQLMSSMALVFQDVMVASDTVANNIALGRPQATRDEIIAAARQAHIHDRIMALPRGYETVVGSKDGFLSGGELQRLTIARAFLAAPPILILDEATAQADPHSELEIQRAISALAAGRTVVIIAHRLTTIQGADQIALIDQGRIVECGTHADLLALDGQYARLWATQCSSLTDQLPPGAGAVASDSGPAAAQQFDLQGGQHA